MEVVATEVQGKKVPLYMDGILYKQLTKYVIPSVQKKDFDYVFIIDGIEGAGKSQLAMQIAKVLDPNFSIDNICFTSEEFIKAVTNAKPHSCIIHDESYNGLSSRASLSEANRLIVSLLMEMRQRNLFVIIVMPTIFMLDRYVALHRARGLFHVYLKDGEKRGYWNYYGQERMKRLYLLGKKMYSYNVGVKYNFFGRFTDTYIINEKDYRKKKKDSLSVKGATSRIDNFKVQRDLLLKLIHRQYEPNQTKIMQLCSDIGFKLDRTTINKIVTTQTEATNETER